MQEKIGALVRRWATALGCTDWVDYEFENGKMVAATCACGKRYTF